MKMMEIPPLKIGNRYIVPDENGEEIEGVLESAAVIVVEKTAYGTYLLEDGRRIIVTCPMTNQEIRDYETDPDNYFGDYHPTTKQSNNYEEAFASLYGTYSKTSKEKLLEFMGNLPEERLAELRKRSQKALAEMYCHGMAVTIMKDQKDRLN